MERDESVLDSGREEETLDYDGDDVEMADADDGEAPAADAAGGGDGDGVDGNKGMMGKKKKRKKKRRSGRNKRPDGPPTKIADINKFVLDTCKRLKEKKSYLVWNAVGCLGVSAVSDLVREVEAIQKCGGQQISDGSRFRTGGGILWNILKSREPKAYKEIMAKGRELEKQFRQTKARPQMSRNENTSSQGSALVEEEIGAQDGKEVLGDPEQLADAEEALPSDNKAKRKPVTERIRVPVAYDDLFEEGEIHEEINTVALETSRLNPPGDVRRRHRSEKMTTMTTTTTRRWWKRRDGEADNDDDLIPMDTQEQEELVRSLEQKQANQSLLWRRVFAGFLLLHAAFLVYSSFHHAWSPWELRYHAYFMEDLPAPMVVIADWIAALACLLAIKGLLQTSRSSKKWLWYSCYTSLLVAIFWAYYILRLPRIRWDIIWLPFGPFIGAALSLYVDRLLLASMQDISTLRSYMYNYKAL